MSQCGIPQNGRLVRSFDYVHLEGAFPERKRLKYIDMELIQNTEATCPNCWETISLTLDLSEPEQSYIEDCPVCCKPMVVAFSSSDGELTALSVDAA